MISGRLERLYSEGYFEGWAFDQEAPERPLRIEIRAADGRVVAEGLANLYRDDLANARQGLGWCAFRLRFAEPARELRRSVLALHDGASGFRIHFALQVPFIAGDGPTWSPGEDAAGFDPFVIERPSQLRACQGLFARFVRARGANAFVRAAYIYMLGRRADPETLAIHSEMLRKGSLTPFRLLEMIAETAEFRARPRALAAPNAPGFPFVEAANAG